MGVRNNCYIKVWEHKPGTGSWEEVRFSTSKKNKDTGEYITDFSGWARFIGKAREKLLENPNVDRFKLKEFEVSNKYDKERDKTYWNIAVFEIEDASEKSTKTNDTKAAAKTAQTKIPEFLEEKAPVVEETLEDEELPF